MTEVEKETKELILTAFKQEPLGCVALSMMFPKDPNRKMDTAVNKVMHEKFSIIKTLAKECSAYETNKIE